MSKHGLLWCALLFFVVFFAWAKFSIIDESITVNAVVMPSHDVRVQNREGGILKEVFVHEGDTVEADQELVRLDLSQLISALNESQKQVDALELKITRLAAEVDNKPLKLDSVLQEKYPEFAKNEMTLYKVRQKQLSEMKENKKRVLRELKVTRRLVKECISPRLDILLVESAALNITKQIDEFYINLLGELQLVRGQRDVFKASVMTLQERLDRAIIRSPIRGVVKQVCISRRGMLVLPGAEIMSLIPLGENVLLEAQVMVSDIGHIHPGEPVTVKINAYDPSRYGVLKAQVDAISAAPWTNEKGKKVYLVRIRTNESFLRTKSGTYYIMPGMTAKASILTGRRSVFNSWF